MILLYYVITHVLYLVLSGSHACTLELCFIGSVPDIMYYLIIIKFPPDKAADSVNLKMKESTACWTSLTLQSKKGRLINLEGSLHINDYGQNTVSILYL